MANRKFSKVYTQTSLHSHLKRYYCIFFHISYAVVLWTKNLWAYGFQHIWKFGSHCFFKHFSILSLSYGSPSYIYMRAVEVVSQFPNSLLMFFNFFSLSIYQFYIIVFKGIDLLLCSVYSTLFIPNLVFIFSVVSIS